MSERELTDDEQRAADEMMRALAEAVAESFVVPQEVFMVRAAAAWRARVAELNAGPLDDRMKLLAALYDCDLEGVRVSVDEIEFAVDDNLNLNVSARLRRSVEVWST